MFWKCLNLLQQYELQNGFILNFKQAQNEKRGLYEVSVKFCKQPILQFSEFPENNFWVVPWELAEQMPSFVQICGGLASKNAKGKVVETISRAWFQTKLHSTLFNYHHKLSVFCVCYNLLKNVISDGWLTWERISQKSINREARVISCDLFECSF